MKIKEKYNKLKELLEEEFDNVNFDNLHLTEDGYEGVIEVPCEFTLYCVIDDTECYLTFDSIDFSTNYTVDEIRELCNKIEKISDEF